MSGAPFTVSIGEVVGPLDLILTLIEERKMLVSDVSLSKIADDFIQFVKSRDTFPSGEAAHFILVAATLLLIKSRSLLPVLSLTNEEEGDIHDLEKRLALYKIFRDASRVLGTLKERMYFGGLKRDTTPVFSPGSDMNTESLFRAANDVLMRSPKIEKKKEISVKTVISLEDMMNRLSHRIERALSVTFKDFVGTPEDKREIVVGFLAVLELVKRGLLLVDQEKHYSDITINYAGNTAPPRYD
ncbi:MAG: ScpA family protein [Patescibacteria group bacterium]